MLFKLLYSLRTLTGFGWLNVIRYTSSRMIISALSSLLISFLMAPWFIRRLQSQQIKQTIREDGPESHLSKAGTPTMGGGLILFSLLSSTLAWADLSNPLVWLTVITTFGYGVIGFVDDKLKITRKSSDGLSARMKLIGQFLFAVLPLGYHYYCRGMLPGSAHYRLAVPLTDFSKAKQRVHLPPWLYLIFSLLVVAGSSNGVNLTDGLDGLAIGPVIISSGTFTILSYLAGTVLRRKVGGTLLNFNMAQYLNIAHVAGAAELAVFCSAMAGSGIGFLWYNTYPASVFMGDVGSLSLGAGLGMVAVLTKNELVWVILGGIFVLETLSVIVQVVSFKLTGKRVFRMAPLHHHFELKGWAEPKVIVRFWIISIILALITLSTLKLR